ncbi:prolyl oligopeptidase family serine peptidase [Labilibacter marinus]|uniref:prolyl oligopeptidase family serine peptidase n=1 Tax=Labilibacter marinus TaxID=1477105 RepID=UPI000B2D44F2|nr:prolyl oligopeptidase family serine peptidase [Labilibacter marinus]
MTSNLINKITCLAIGIALMSCNNTPKMEKLNYPVTKKVDTVDNYFNTEVADPYRWLEDDMSQETKEWVIAQNEVTQSLLSKIPYRKAIEDRLTQIWDYTKMGAPVNRSGLIVYGKNDGLQNQAVYYYKTSEEGEEKVLIDPNKLSEDGTVALSSFSISKDGKYLGYTISRSGSDWREIFVKEIASDKVLDDHIEWVKFSGISWYKDGFFFSRFDEPKEGDELKGVNKNPKLCYHKLGDDVADAEVVYEDPANPERLINAGVTDDEAYLVIHLTESTSGNALYLKSLNEKEAEIVKVIEDFEYDYSIIDHANGEFMVKTNYNAPKERIAKFSIDTYKKENWEDVIPEGKDVLSTVSVKSDKLIVQYMTDAHDVVKVFDLNGKHLYNVDLPSIGSVGGFGGEKEDEVTYFSFNSFVYPSAIYKYNIAKNTTELYWKPEIDIDFDQYETKQVFFTSKDGTKVPMFIVHKKGISLDGNNPTMLYGYGGFNISLTPTFSLSRMVLLENDGIYAMVNLRGGGEYGKEWHEAGTKLQKQNVFDDCIAAAEYLIDNKYTSPEKLAVHGGSNGGLLVGAVSNQRPDLFKVAIPAVGVMDMLRYHKFTIGRFWAADYGTSEDDKEMFDYLYGYSPIHNVKENLDYPAVMVMTADHDDRVVPAHSFKYIAELQDKYNGNNPVIIRIESKAGHGAGKPTSKQIESAADIYSFMFYNMNESISYN